MTNIFSLRPCIITTSTIDQFSVCFFCNFNSYSIDVEFLAQSFNELCSTLLDQVAPLKVRTRAIVSTSPNFIYIAPLKTEFTKCFDRQSRRAQQQDIQESKINNRGPNNGGQNSAKIEVKQDTSRDTKT